MPFTDIRVDISGARMHGIFCASVVIYFKILQEYRIEKSQFTSIISAPPPLGELPKGKYIYNNNEQDKKDYNEINE